MDRSKGEAVYKVKFSLSYKITGIKPEYVGILITSHFTDCWTSRIAMGFYIIKHQIQPESISPLSFLTNG